MNKPKAHKGKKEALKVGDRVQMVGATHKHFRGRKSGPVGIIAGTRSMEIGIRYLYEKHIVWGYKEDHLRKVHKNFKYKKSKTKKRDSGGEWFPNYGGPAPFL